MIVGRTQIITFPICGSVKASMKRGEVCYRCKSEAQVSWSEQFNLKSWKERKQKGVSDWNSQKWWKMIHWVEEVEDGESPIVMWKEWEGKSRIVGNILVEGNPWLKNKRECPTTIVKRWLLVMYNKWCKWLQFSQFKIHALVDEGKLWTGHWLEFADHFQITVVRFFLSSWEDNWGFRWTSHP